MTVLVNGGTKKESNETCCPDRFGNSSNSLLIDGWGVGMIVNDD